MSGRLQQVFVLAVTMVTLEGPAVDAQQAGREMSSPMNFVLNELANRCRSLAGEQAAVDLINIQTTVMNCVNMQQLYTEIVQERPNLRKVFQVICGKKDRLLTCANAGLQILERCLRPEEKKYIETQYQILEATGNFFCNNTDDIASIASEDDGKCVVYVGGKSQNCAMQVFGTNDEGLRLEDLEKHLASKEKPCKQIEETLQCMTDGDDKCKDSSFLRILNSYGNEVLDAISCPDSGRGGAAGLLALGTSLTSLVVPLALCLAAPRVLHLQ